MAYGIFLCKLEYYKFITLVVSMSKDSLSNSTFKVEYSDPEETVIVKPSSWKVLEDIEYLQKEIIYLLAEVDGAFGDLLRPSNTEFWGHVRKMAALLPIVGQEKPGLDVDRIEDAEDIIRIFITTSKQRDPQFGSVFVEGGTPLLPGEVSRINSLNFTKILNHTQERLMAPQKTTTRRKAQAATKQTS